VTEYGQDTTVRFRADALVTFFTHCHIRRALRHIQPLQQQQQQQKRGLWAPSPGLEWEKEAVGEYAISDLEVKNASYSTSKPQNFSQFGIYA
jgi:hypothetical protein